VDEMNGQWINLELLQEKAELPSTHRFRHVVFE